MKLNTRAKALEVSRKADPAIYEGDVWLAEWAREFNECSVGGGRGQALLLRDLVRHYSQDGAAV